MAQIPCRKCDFCKVENKNTATFYCNDCEQSLCLECKRDSHEKVTIFQDHNLININKAWSRVFKQKPDCKSHKNKFLYYCIACDCLTCKDCMTSSHSGHKTDTIKKIVGVRREDAQKIQRKLNAKGVTVLKTLETIKTKQRRQIKSDFESYVQKVEKTSRELHGIVDDIKTISMTTASNFQTTEKQDLDMKRVFFERQYNELSDKLLQIDNLLQERHDVTFFTGWKRLKTDRLQHMCEIDLTLQSPRRIASFSEDIFMRTVIGEIDKRLTTRQCRKSSMANAPYMLSAAIDIGTTYTGYAFSSKDDYIQDPTKIYTSLWARSKLLSFKAPTSVLLDSRQEFIAFGYEAEDKYYELVADEEHEDYYYFHRFKMFIYGKNTRDLKIRDISGKEIKALKVFQYTIQYMKDHLFKTLLDKKIPIKESDLHYVLTVPAIWEDSAKQFMREAASMSGISSKQLRIVSEPDAASIYCQHLKTERWNFVKQDTFAQIVKAGMKYMVVNLGGGTADITVHQRYGDGLPEELLPPSGGPWGGTAIDEAFHSFLKRIYGPKVMEELRQTEPEDFIDLFREFETKKRSIRVDQTSRVVITLPISLPELVRSHTGKMETALEQSSYGQAVSYSKLKLHISPDTFRDLFKSTTEALIKHLERMFRDDKLSDLENLIMVGGFSECELIQHRMKDKFGKHKKIIIPEEAGLAVLKGAVIYGYLFKDY